MKFKRDHGYKQQKRLKYERAINKYTGKLKETKTTTNFITKIIYYSTKKLQINLTLKVSSPQRESYFEKFSKLDVSMVSVPLFSLCALETVVIYKSFAFSSSVLHYLMHKVCFEAGESHICLSLTRIVKARLHRRFLSQQLDAIFVAAKSH